MDTRRLTTPIIVLDPDAREARQVADWLRSAGLGQISTARTCDEAIFMLGRQRASLLIIDERVPETAERRLLSHIAKYGREPAPAIVRLICAGSANPLMMGRAMATEAVQKPLSAHDVVVRVGTALQRPDLLGRMDRDRDQSAEHLAAARRMQLGLLPTAGQLADLEAECGVGVAGFCHSGDAVGGDFWGAWPTGRGRLALAVADFAGHGLSAALNTFRLHAILSEQTLPRGMPVRMTTLLNQRLHGMLPRGHYATMIYAQIDPTGRRVAWCSAGGPPPMFVSADGRTDLPGRGLPLGVAAGAVYRRVLIRLPAAGILCMFSDGLFESGPGAIDVPRQAIAQALMPAAACAAAGHLAEASRQATRALEDLRGRYVAMDHSDDVMAVCLAIGATRR
jgi:sigma-B regulation protein RsbU (phosphoserine phosphatase)